MRIFIILLVVANLTFFGVNTFILDRNRAPSTTSKVAASDGSSLVLLQELKKSEPMSDIVEVATEKPAGGEEGNDAPVLCIKIVGDWDLNGFNSVKKSMQSIDKLIILEGKERRKKLSYWVMIPSFGSKQAAVKAKQKLRSVKIIDTFIIKSGINKNAISLGLYSKAAGAKRRARYANAQNIGIAEANIEVLTLYVDRYWLKVASEKGELGQILSIIGKGIIDTELEQCKIVR